MTEQSLWDGVGTPAITNASDGAPGLTLGTIWRTTINTGSVRGISWRFPDTLPSATVKALLYQMTALGTGTLLATKDFAAPVAGQWCSQLFDTPVAVTSGIGYIAAIWTPNRYVATLSYWDDGPVTSGDLVGIQDGTDPFGYGATRNGRFTVGATPAFPADSSNATNYWVDLVFDDGTGINGTLAATLPALTVALTDQQDIDIALGEPDSPWRIGQPTATPWATGTPDSPWAIGTPRG